MTRNLKIMGVALIAAFALGAVAASAASAESFDFYSEVQHTDLAGSGEGTSKFAFSAGTVTCSTAKYEGTMSSEESTSLTLAPLFEGCTVDPTGTASVSMNGCQFVLTASTKEESTYKAGLDITCGEGKTISIVVKVAGVTKCTIEIPAQSLSTVTVSEVSEGDLKAVAAVEGLKYSQTTGSGSGACTKAENNTNGVYEGVAKIGGSLEELDATLSLQPPKSVVAVDLSTKFTGLNDKKATKIYNLTDQKLEINKISWAGEFFKFIKETCAGGIAKGGSCEIELECIKAVPKGKSVYIVAESKAPRALAAGELEGCV
jgi:hypothetical protein